MNCEKNAIQQNLKQMFSIIDEAIEKNIDILVFPEMNITGFSDPFKYPDMIITLESEPIKQLLDYTDKLPIKIIAGIIEKNPGNKPYITQFVIERGQISSVYRKITIINEEIPWFSAGSLRDTKIFFLNDIPTGMSVCADIDNEDLFKTYAIQGAKLVFESAAPGLYGSQETRNWKEGFEWWRGECLAKFSSYARKHKLWIFVSTQAGRTKDEDFPGGGYVFSPSGDCLYSTPDWNDYRVYLEVDLDNYFAREI